MSAGKVCQGGRGGEGAPSAAQRCAEPAARAPAHGSWGGVSRWGSSSLPRRSTQWRRRWSRQEWPSGRPAGSALRRGHLARAGDGQRTRVRRCPGGRALVHRRRGSRQVLYVSPHPGRTGDRRRLHGGPPRRPPGSAVRGEPEAARRRRPHMQPGGGSYVIQSPASCQAHVGGGW